MRVYRIVNLRGSMFSHWFIFGQPKYPSLAVGWEPKARKWMVYTPKQVRMGENFGEQVFEGRGDWERLFP